MNAEQAFENIRLALEAVKHLTPKQRKDALDMYKLGWAGGHEAGLTSDESPCDRCAAMSEVRKLRAATKLESEPTSNQNAEILEDRCEAKNCFDNRCTLKTGHSGYHHGSDDVLWAQESPVPCARCRELETKLSEFQAIAQRFGVRIEPIKVNSTPPLPQPMVSDNGLWEILDGVPHYLHSEKCHGACEYTCNGEKGFELAKAISLKLPPKADPSKSDPYDIRFDC